MKNINKKRIFYLNILTLVLLFFLMIILIIQTIDINIIPVNTLRNTPIVVILIFSIALVMFMNGQMIFEYDISGEVLSIKNYNWFLMNKKLISPIFEIPKKSLIKFEIEEVFLKKYLIIFFKKESGKIMKTKFDITGCTNKQTRNIHLELVYFLINTNHGKKEIGEANQ